MIPHPDHQLKIKKPRYYYVAALILFLLADFFRLWQLGQTPYGMGPDELINIQLAMGLFEGDIRLFYDTLVPTREGLYHIIIALMSVIFGSGQMIWRMPSTWLSLISLALTLRLVRSLFGSRSGLLTIGLMGVSFWGVWSGRAVLHLVMLPPLSALIIYLMVKAFSAQDESRSAIWFTLLGILIGLSQYAHIAARLFISIFVFYCFYLWLTQRDVFRKQVWNIFYTLGMILILQLPLLAFLARHPEAWIGEYLWQQDLFAELPSRFLALLGSLTLYGDTRPLYNLPGRPLLAWWMAILMLIGLGISARRWRERSYGIVLIWFFSGVLLMLLSPNQPDYSLVAVIYPVIFMLPVVGFVSIFRAIGEREALSSAPVTQIAVVVALILVGVGGLRTYQDYFIDWATREDVRAAFQSELGQIAYTLDTWEGDEPISICSYPVEGEFVLNNRQLMEILIHRQSRPIRYFDCTQGIILAEGGDPQLLVFPQKRYYETLPGSLMEWMRYAEDVEIEGISPDTIMTLDVSVILADKVGSFITTAPTAFPPESGDIRLTELPVVFESNVAFLGYTVRDDTLRATDWVELTTYWRVDGPPPDDLTLFAHLLGNPVLVIAQDDGLGVDMDTLQPRDVFIQYSMIQTPGNMAPGLYPLSIGIYNPETDIRLSVINEVAEITRLFLLRIEILP